MTTCTQKPRILGVVLAGGLSTRFGTDKATAMLGEKSLLHHVCARAAPQVDKLLINRNGNISRDADHAYDMLADDYPGAGPLAGILAGLGLADAEGYSLVATFPCDTPFFPGNLVARLRTALEQSSAEYCLPYRNNIAHRAFALWRVSCAQDLLHGFRQGRIRSLQSIEQILTPAAVAFPPQGEGPGGDAFFNINTTDNLGCAVAWMRARSGQ